MNPQKKRSNTGKREVNVDFDTYQKRARETAIYDDPMYPILGLASEAGEVCDKVAKNLRDKTPVDPESRAKELGDVLWMIANIACDMGMDLSYIAELNLVKLYSRQERGVIGGSGDNR